MLNTGTLSTRVANFVPVLWISTFHDWNVGWILNIDYSEATPGPKTGIHSASRIALWLTRNSDLRIKKHLFRVGGGVGVGIWKYNLNGDSSYRGAMGFTGGLESKLKVAEIEGLNLGFGYYGLNVPGTGLVDDGLYLQVRYQLF